MYSIIQSSLHCVIIIITCIDNNDKNLIMSDNTYWQTLHWPSSDSSNTEQLTHALHHPACSLAAAKPVQDNKK